MCVLWGGSGGSGAWLLGGVVVENLDLKVSRDVPLRIGWMRCTMMDVTVDRQTDRGRSWARDWASFSNFLGVGNER